MTDERDPKVSRRYRELASEEPSRELDQSILAAAHRAADRSHAPLVTPAGRHRWYFALGAAAVLLLAVGIVVHVERDRPDAEPVPASQPAAPAAKQEQQSAGRSPAPMAPRSGPAQGRAAPKEAAPQASADAPTRAEAVMRTEARVQQETPERWLERIVELRKAGRHEEADKELAEFRKRYPDYKLPENVVRP